MAAKEHTLICKNCSKEFKTLNPHAKYCCYECRKEFYKKNPKPKPVVEKVEVKKKSLAEINEEERKAGMTYGKYVVKMKL